MSRCGDTLRWVTAFVNGELDGARASAVRGHARTCAACAALIDDEARVRDQIAALEPAEPPPALWAGIDARLARAEVADAERSRVWLWWQGVRRPVLATAGLAVVGAAALAIGLRVRAPSSGPTVAGVVEPAPVAVAEPPRARGEQLALELAAAERRYRDAVEELREIVAEQSREWPADALARFEARLGALDREVKARRDALAGASDPAEGDALFVSYRAQLALLQDVALGAGVP